MNLLKETIRVLKDNNKKPTDVLWVGCSEFKSSWKNFEEIADIEYDNGYGSQEVAKDLIIMGINFWMERHEYDGSEWWEFKTMDDFNPSKERKIIALTTGQARKLGFDFYGWESLSVINGIEKKEW